MEEAEQCHNKTSSQVRQIPEESCEIRPNKVCQPENNLVPYLDPETQENCKIYQSMMTFTFHSRLLRPSQIDSFFFSDLQFSNFLLKCKAVPRETCSFGVIRQLGEKPLITKWCYDTDNELISQQLKRRGKVTFDEGDKREAVEKTGSFSENDLEDININNRRFLQDVESVKNVPGHSPASADNKSSDKNIIEGKRNNPLSLVDSNYAFENSINAGQNGNFVGHDFHSFQEMINHEFHQNIPTTFQEETEKKTNVKEGNDILESNIEVSAKTKTLTNIDRTKNREDEKSSSSRLRVIFPDTKAEGGGNKKDDDSDTADTRPLIEKMSAKTNIKELPRQTLAATESLHIESSGDSSGFLGQEETTIASRLESINTIESDKKSFHFNGEELQTQTFKGRVYNEVFTVYRAGVSIIIF